MLGEKYASKCFSVPPQVTPRYSLELLIFALLSRLESQLPCSCTISPSSVVRLGSHLRSLLPLGLILGLSDGETDWPWMVLVPELESYLVKNLELFTPNPLVAQDLEDWLVLSLDFSNCVCLS